MTTHDAGPWLGKDKRGKYKTGHGWTAHHVGVYCSQFAPIWAGDKVVALVVASSDNPFARFPSIDANAALIAAAPDMRLERGRLLTALERATTALEIILRSAGLDPFLDDFEKVRGYASLHASVGNETLNGGHVA